MVGDLEKVTNAWNHKPQFNIDVQMLGHDGTVSVSTDDKVFHWLNDGTKDRCAWMTHDFEAKTKVGWLGSQSGLGGVLKDSRGNKVLTRPRSPVLPGIEARKWDEALMSKYQNTPSFGSGVIGSLMNIYLRLIAMAVIAATTHTATQTKYKY